ncbi:MAG: hypothetical protein ABSH44_18315 [Bryobacteraceae bacterium]|jgi:uncharacterized protein (TIGR03437 family)
MIRRLLAAVIVPLGFAALLHAAPMLRLVNTAVVAVPLPVGASGGTQIVEAYNAGDGSLSPSVSAPVYVPAASVSWIVPSVGSPRACTTTAASATCIPLQFALNTSTLAAGTYTGTVTVSDPNAVDSPQTVTVTVRMGGVDVYVAPGSSYDVRFSTNSSLTGVATTQDGSRWLSLALDGTGSFRFTYPYKIHVAPSSGMASGTYTGSLVTSGSSFAPDDQTIPVTMRVTTQPIAQPSPDHVGVRLAQGAPPLPMAISLNNSGQGSLTIGTVTATTTDGGRWLTASANAGGWAAIALDPGALAPGSYSGTVSMASNAVNGTVSVPVSFQVVAKSAPLASYSGVVDNAIFGSGDAVARGDIVDVFGEQFLFGNLTYSPGVPLTTQITGPSVSSVLVNGRPAPLFFSSYYQIAFQVPMETAVGTALVQVQRDGLAGNTVSVQVVDRAPRLLLAAGGPFGAIQNARDLSYPMPVGYLPGVTTHPAQVGDTLTIYAIGLGTTYPAVGTNVPAPSSEPLARLTPTPVVNFGGTIFGTVSATPAYAGLTPTYVGLYQVNVTIPAGVPAGLVAVRLAFPDSVSNSVQIAIQ